MAGANATDVPSPRARMASSLPMLRSANIARYLSNNGTVSSSRVILSDLMSCSTAGGAGSTEL